MALPFKTPSTLLLSGPSQAGKTWFTDRLLANVDSMFEANFASITWCYGAVIPKLKLAGHLNIHFHQGLPDLDNFTPPSPGLIIIDDLMSEHGNVVADLFTKHSHHKNLTVIFIVQNLFHQGKNMRDISLNSHYIVLFKSPRDRQQIQYFARQIMPECSKEVVRVFDEATREPHSYLLFDMTQSIPDALRIRTKIFPGEQLTVYTTQKECMQTFTL